MNEDTCREQKSSFFPGLDAYHGTALRRKTQNLHHNLIANLMGHRDTEQVGKALIKGVI